MVLWWLQVGHNIVIGCYRLYTVPLRFFQKPENFLFFWHLLWWYLWMFTWVILRGSVDLSQIRWRAMMWVCLKIGFPPIPTDWIAMFFFFQNQDWHLRGRPIFQMVECAATYTSWPVQQPLLTPWPRAVKSQLEAALVFTKRKLLWINQTQPCMIYRTLHTTLNPYKIQEKFIADVQTSHLRCSTPDINPHI